MKALGGDSSVGCVLLLDCGKAVEMDWVEILPVTGLDQS